MCNKYIRKITKSAVILALCMALLLGMFPAMGLALRAGAADSYTYTIATIKGSGVNVRSGPGTGYRVMTTLSTGETARILASTEGTDGYTWYLLHSNWGYEGYMREDLLTVSSLTLSASNVSDYTQFVNGLVSQGFPESYIPGLLYLHYLYPSWQFTAVHTGLDWAASVAGESALWSSMVEPGCLSSWKSTQPGAYNWTTGKWIGLDGDWVQASDDIIAYYMDPRNFFSPEAVFQFLSQSFDGAEDSSDKDVFLSNLRTMMDGSFMYTAGKETFTYSNNGESINYVETFYEAGKKWNVSPYCLASMVLVEQGFTGSSMVDGNVSGYEGLYNFFNIGAYTTSSMSATQRGLWYAGGGDSGSTSYNRPWNTRYKSILGGAEWFYDEYISCGQNTLYTKRFNVTPSNPDMLYKGQYMASVYGAAIEGCINSDGYSEAMRKANLVFYIPVYENMPEIVSMPLKDGSPNNKLTSLSVSGISMTPTFSADTAAYSLVVPSGTSSITITARTADQNATVSIGGKAGASVSVNLSTGDNAIPVVVTAQNGDKRTYTITATRRGISYTDLYNLSDGLVTGLRPGLKVDAFLSGFSFGEGASLQVIGPDGTAKDAAAALGTGDTLKVTLADQTLLVYTVVIYGDVSGDGVISNADRIKVRNHILGTGVLSGSALTAADANHDGRISNSDRILIRNHILGTGNISQ